jgi:hypothetical protein
MRDETSRAPVAETEPVRASRPRLGRRAGRATLATLVAALGLTAVVGGTTAAAATMSPTAAKVATPAPAPPPPGAPCRSITGGPCGQRTIVLTDRNGGQTLTVARGTSITVTLSGRDGVWSEPQSSNGTVLHRVAARRDRDGGASGIFVAERDGTADITSTVSPHCSGICPDLLRLWVVHIVVRG